MSYAQQLKSIYNKLNKSSEAQSEASRAKRSHMEERSPLIKTKALKTTAGIYVGLGWTVSFSLLLLGAPVAAIAISAVCFPLMVAALGSNIHTYQRILDSIETKEEKKYEKEHPELYLDIQEPMRELEPLLQSMCDAAYEEKLHKKESPELRSVSLYIVCQKLNDLLFSKLTYRQSFTSNKDFIGLAYNDDNSSFKKNMGIMSKMLSGYLGKLEFKREDLDFIQDNPGLYHTLLSSQPYHYHSEEARKHSVFKKWINFILTENIEFDKEFFQRFEKKEQASNDELFQALAIDFFSKLKAKPYTAEEERLILNYIKTKRSPEEYLDFINTMEVGNPRNSWRQTALNLNEKMKYEKVIGAAKTVEAQPPVPTSTEEPTVAIEPSTNTGTSSLSTVIKEEKAQIENFLKLCATYVKENNTLRVAQEFPDFEALCATIQLRLQNLAHNEDLLPTEQKVGYQILVQENFKSLNQIWHRSEYLKDKEEIRHRIATTVSHIEKQLEEMEESVSAQILQQMKGLEQYQTNKTAKRLTAHK